MGGCLDGWIEEWMDGWKNASYRHTDNYEKYDVKMFSYAVNVM